MTPRAQAPNMTLLLRELEFGPATTRDLVSVLRIDRHNVAAYLREARLSGLVHVCGWEPHACPVYALGFKRDAQRPSPRTPAQTSKRYRDKRR